MKQFIRWLYHAQLCENQKYIKQWIIKLATLTPLLPIDSQELDLVKRMSAELFDNVLS